MTDFQYDVFLSHSRKDKAIVADIAKRLRKDGVRVALDDEDREKSRVLILCTSRNAFAEEWKRIEVGTLPFRDPRNKEQKFISLRLDDTRMPPPLLQFFPLSWLPADREMTHAKLLEVSGPKLTRSPQVETALFAEKTIQLEDAKFMSSCAFSPDRTRVAGGCLDRSVRIWDLATGRCLRRLKGHEHDRIMGLAWSPDQRRILSSSDDKTVRIWDVQTGECVSVLAGHKAPVQNVIWSGDQRHALSCSWDSTIRYWDLSTGRCEQVLEGHTDSVFSMALHSDQTTLVSGSTDNTVRLWDIETGRCYRIFNGHKGYVPSLLISADRRRIVSCSFDQTVRVWEADTGRCLRILEGHQKWVRRLAWGVDHRLALSTSSEGEVFIWDLETGGRVQILQGHEEDLFGAAWGVDQDRAYSGDVHGCVKVWNLTNVIESYRSSSSTPASQLQYTNAKVLLVGDTGVGKSGLAERLVNKQFVPTKSSHARKAHVLESETVETEGGISLHRETVLWDLAGQPAYRLVHQLSMEDAALACVLFDCRSETNPFEGAAYWSQVIDQAQVRTKLRKILIAARVDVGGLPAGAERIESFARENGFERFISTSASTGEGCEELLAAIRDAISWDDVPRVTTAGTLAPLRQYIARLKGAAPSLLTITALHEGFSADFGEKIAFDEFLAHLERLEATDAIDLLVFHTTGAAARPEDLVLLDPTRVDAYASALLVAAKDEPDGPGHLLESRVRDGSFKLEPEERIGDRQSERHVLWYVMENMLARDLALRERIKGEDYIVFPSQCTSELRFPGAAAFGVAFGFAGAVRSVYATLIAQLAHYEGFRKREFFQDAAAYRPEGGGLCLVRLRDFGRGQGELQVLFDADTIPDVKQGFLEFVGKHLEAKGTLGTVMRRHAYHCVACRNPFEDRVVKARLEAKKKSLVCPICEKRTPLVDLLARPTAAAASVAAQIGSDARAGRQRMTAALVIRAKEAEGKFDVFLSHNSKDKAAVEKIAKQLKAVGLRPWLDKWNLAAGDTILDALEKAIKTIQCAALCFGPADVGIWHIMEIRTYVANWAKKKARMIPVILPGVTGIPELPLFVEQTLWVDMRDWEAEENDGFYRLVCGILGRPPGDAPMKRFGVRDVAEWQRMLI